MIRVGVVGFGFMGRTHFSCYKALKDVKVVAICDENPEAFDNEKQIVGNIKNVGLNAELENVKYYGDYEVMLAEAELDAVSIALPSHLHCEYTLKALGRGVHVFCEKPISLIVEHGLSMIKTAQEKKLILQIGHCIRFWPEYLKLEEIIATYLYGKVKLATFTRFSPMPKWSSGNWVKNKNLSGGMLKDLHIHDSDFINYLWGLPKSVLTRSVKTTTGEIEHIVTDYMYDNNIIVTSEASWNVPESFGFKMGFSVFLEKATITYDSSRDDTLTIFPVDGDAFSPALESGDGYSGEISYFINCLKEKDAKLCDLHLPLKSLDSLKLIIAEEKSAQSNKEIFIK